MFYSSVHVISSYMTCIDMCSYVLAMQMWCVFVYIPLFFPPPPLSFRSSLSLPRFFSHFRIWTASMATVQVVTMTTIVSMATSSSSVVFRERMSTFERGSNPPREEWYHSGRYRTHTHTHTHLNAHVY